MTHRSRLVALLGAALALLAIGATPASASFHFMKIREVFAGAPGNPQAQYVMLQMYSGGQQFVGGHSVRVYDAAGLQIGQFTFPGAVGNGSNQATILVATPQAASFFGINPDLAMTAVIPPAGGKVCFDSIDCVAWGTYSGPATGVGNPESPSGGIPSDYAIERHLGIDDDPTTLSAADDTGDSADDFFIANPEPRTNAGSIGTRGTVTLTNGFLALGAAAGVADKVTLSKDGDQLVVSDTGRALRSGDGNCFSQGATTMLCSPAVAAELNLGDGADAASVTADVATELNGGPGADTLTGGPKADVLDGGSEADKLTGGLGPDDLAGGTGQDTVTYSARTGGVTVDIDDEKDDGSSLDAGGGRRDWVKADVENLTGGAGADTLTGDGDANILNGLASGDTLRGGFGIDTVTYAGRAAAVTVKLDGAANDGSSFDQRPGTTTRDNVFAENLVGGNGGDTLHGDGFANALTGGPGTDTLFGFGGPDSIFAKDGGTADAINCGAGTDTANKDNNDTVPPAGSADTCETIK